MDWSRAKSLVILFLVIVNAFLFSLNFLAGNKFKVTASDKNDIIKLLGKADIELDCKIPVSFKPQKQLLLTELKCNPDFWKNLLMEGRNITENIITEQDASFYSDNEFMSVHGADIYYEKQNQEKLVIVENANDAKILCNKIVGKLNSVYTDFQLDYVEQDKNDYYVYYSQIYNGKTFTDNFMKFHVTSYGIKSIDISYRNIKGDIGKAYEIYSPVDALFTFLQENKIHAGKSKLYINNVELVYHSINDNKLATPCYLIEIEDFDEMILIDAYHNLFLDEYDELSVW